MAAPYLHTAAIQGFVKTYQISWTLSDTPWSGSSTRTFTRVKGDYTREDGPVVYYELADDDVSRDIWTTLKNDSRAQLILRERIQESVDGAQAGAEFDQQHAAVAASYYGSNSQW